MKQLFYDELPSLMCDILKKTFSSMDGDMNAQIGKNGHNKYSLHNLSHRNGQHLIDFTIENRLTCKQYKLYKREGKIMDILVRKQH